MLKLLTESQEKRIINNVVKACKDIDALNKQGYNFLYCCCGFIAHYDIYGFKYYYRFTRNLASDLIFYQDQNQYGNFFPHEENYDYYMQKKKIYNAICEKIK